MLVIVIVVCITIIIVVASVCFTVISIRHGTYGDIVRNDETYKAAIAECNKMSGKIAVVKEAAKQASLSIESDVVKDAIKIDFAKYVIDQIKNL